jgi:chromosomal replication initiation ATPase DnaA
MCQNPYRYENPLDPEKDKLVCIPRTEDIHRVIGGIRTGDYWSILGPKQIGKTTFLHQIKNEFPNAYYVYLNFKSAPTKKAENFYQRLIHTLVAEIPSQRIKANSSKWKEYSPELGFFEFLKAFKPKHDPKKIILLFDDIDDFPFLKTFLGLWRKVFHERNEQKQLNKYAVIVCGSRDLIAATIGPISPFNIAENIVLEDFSREDSEKLITEPMKHLNIEIAPKAKETILSQISGHPQLLQHACHLLVEKAMNSNQGITEKTVEEVQKDLLATNVSLRILQQNLKKDSKLDRLVRDILSGKKSKFHPNKEYELAGAGSIVDRNSYCAIRNRIYEHFIKNLVKNSNQESSNLIFYKDRKNDD